MTSSLRTRPAAALVALPAAVAAAGLGLLFLSAVFAHTVREISPLNVTDFLISYRGGFVRRGFLGDLLYRLPFLTSLHRVELTLKALSVSAYLASLSLLTARVYRAARSWPLTIAIVLQPFLFGFPVLNGQWMKKDQLLILAFYLSLRLIEEAPISGARLLALDVVAVAAVLTHELYGMAIVPLLIAVVAARRASTRAAAALARSALMFSPPLLALLAAGLSRGDAGIAAAILAAWRAKGVALVDWTQGIDALGDASVWRIGIDEFLQYARHGSWQRLYFTVGYWIAIAILSAGILGLAASLTTQTADLRRRAIGDVWRLSALTAVPFAPLFIMANDYGRWIFLWLSVTAAVVFSPLRDELMMLVRAVTPRPLRGLFASDAGVVERLPGRASPLQLTAVASAVILGLSLLALPMPTFMMEGCCSVREVFKFSLVARLGQIVLRLVGASLSYLGQR